MGKNGIKYGKIIGFMPLYRENFGNATKIIYEEGQDIVDKSIKSFLKDYSKIYFLDLKAIREYYGNFLGIKNLVPIPFDEKVFIPLKVRKPRVKNDGAIGYFYVNFIDYIVEEEGQIFIIFKDGRKEKILLNKATVEKHITNGFIIERLIKLNLKHKYATSDEDLLFLVEAISYLKRILL